MQLRPFIAATTLVVAALALAGCDAPAAPSPLPSVTTEPTATAAPEPTPTPTTVPVPEPTTPPAASPLDPAAVIDAVIAKDAAAVVAQLGDPVRVVTDSSDGSVAASEAEANLSITLTNGENFKPADDATIAALASGPHPEFGAGDAVVMAGSQGTVLAFIAGGYYLTFMS
jgi:hypothetical protein